MGSPPLLTIARLRALGRFGASSFRLKAGDRRFDPAPDQPTNPRAPGHRNAPGGASLARCAIAHTSLGGYALCKRKVGRGFRHDLAAGPPQDMFGSFELRLLAEPKPLEKKIRMSCKQPSWRYAS